LKDAENAPSDDARGDPGRVPIEDRWGPVTGRRRVETDAPSFRRRWFAAVVCMVVLIGGLALLGL